MIQRRSIQDSTRTLFDLLSTEEVPSSASRPGVSTGRIVQRYEKVRIRIQY